MLKSAFKGKKKTQKVSLSICIGVSVFQAPQKKQ